MNTRGFIVAVSVGLTALAVGSEAMAGTPTSARVYRPFASSGKAAIRVTKTVRGYCWTNSIATDRIDAWRCFGGGSFIYDPCFSSSSARDVVLCPTTWWKGSGIEIKLTKSLPKAFGKLPQPSARLRPWAIETFSGLHCQANTGAGTVKDGLDSSYFCIHSNQVLWGGPSLKTEPWTIYVAPPSAPSLTRRANIWIAWS
jgi:hypothetical protein